MATTHGWAKVLLLTPLLMAQGPSYGPGSAPALQSDLTGLTATVTALQNSLTAAQATIPAKCSVTPSMDTLSGSAGSQPCYVPSDATRPTVVQAAQAMTDASGNWTVTWSKPFQTSTPFVRAEPINSTSTQPIQCNIAPTSATVASGKCWTSPTTITLPGLATSLLGLVLQVNQNVAANVAVRVAGRDLTQ